VTFEKLFVEKDIIPLSIKQKLPVLQTIPTDQQLTEYDDRVSEKLEALTQQYICGFEALEDTT